MGRDVHVFGAEVNAASKLGEDRAVQNEILRTGSASAGVGDAAAGLGVSFERLDIEVPGADSSYRVHYRL